LCSRAVKFLNRISDYSSSNGGWPVIGMDQYVLDFLIIPYGLILARGILPDDIAQALFKICDLVERYTPLAKEVPSYRRYIANLAGGSPHETAIGDLPCKIFQASWHGPSPRPR